MSVFAIRHIDVFGESQFYVGEDEVLWDWLLADNVESAGYGPAVVAAPEDYVFNAGRGMVKHLPSYGEVKELPNEYPAFTQKHYLRPGPVEAGKALMMMNEYANVLTYFSAEDFAALEVDETRIRSVHFFYQ